MPGIEGKNSHLITDRPASLIHNISGEGVPEKVAPNVKNAAAKLAAIFFATLGKIREHLGLNVKPVSRDKFTKSSIQEAAQAFLDALVEKVKSHLSSKAENDTDRSSSVEDFSEGGAEDILEGLPPDYMQLETEVVGTNNKVEHVVNSCKNLKDGVLALHVKEGETPEQAAEVIIQALKVFSEKEPPPTTFTFRGNSAAVNEEDIFILKSLNSLFQGNESAGCKRALVEHLSVKQDLSQKRLHIPEPLSKAMGQMKTRKDARRIAFYLMSAAVNLAGGRRLDLGKLEKLLNDPRIQKLPLLKAAIIKEAKLIQLEAIRAALARIVWGLKEVPRAGKKAWEAEAKKLNKESEKDTDVAGIRNIAKRAKVELPEIKPEALTFLGELTADLQKFKELVRK